MSCICGHEPEDHKNESGECEVEGCRCAGYENDKPEDE